MRPSVPDACSDPAAYRLGHDGLGRALTGFCHLLLRHAGRGGSRHLAFVSRDGDLPLRCTQRLIARLGMRESPACSYIHLSRQSTFLPALKAIDASSIERALEVRGGGGSLARALAYLGMPLAPLGPVFARLDIDPEEPDMTSGAIARLVADGQFRLAVGEESRRQAALLAAYLEQENIGTSAATLLVDIGWRGTIPANLRAAFAGESAFAAPAGVFLGLWSEGGPPARLPPGSVGLLADMRRRRNILEGAAWYAAFLLEAVCRADEGTTLGYEPRDGRIAPVLADAMASRRAEAQAAPLAAEIRRGILDYIDEHGADADWAAASDVQLRRQAQRSLLRLACFPTAEEIAVGGRLVHTEGQAPDWWAPLIDPRASAHPLLAPRRWLAGLASPWRTGYIRHTGGPILATAYLCLESALLAAPYTIRASLAQGARRTAGKNHRMT